MLLLSVGDNIAINWEAVGVIGGAIYATYQVLTNNAIRGAVLELKLAIQDRFAKIEQTVAVNFERQLALERDVKELQRQILQTQRDIAYRDGKAASPEQLVMARVVPNEG